MPVKKLLPAAILIVLFMRLSAQTWVVPDDQKAVTAPFKFTPEMQKQGEQTYLKNCQSCHGLPGKDNWARLTPPPGDLAASKAQSQTDGEIFFRITTGKAPMPEFRNIIPEEERWHVIAFLRSFNPKYVQPEPAAKAVFTGRTVSLAMAWDETQKKVAVTATEKLKDGQTAPAASVEVMLYVKRYFGKLQVDETRTTNSAGKALFTFPSDLPGNKDGYVELTAAVNDPKNAMHTTPAGVTLAIGKPTDRPGLTNTRAWWSTRDKAPIWIMATYTGAVLIVWGFIFYILYLVVVRMRKLGKA
ncbi:MAG TPA: cytochrome c [Bacteroidales bacterium]|nr:cytochrome c [Bacteroidales bacterium]